MKILIISSSYIPAIGGLENFVRDLAAFFLSKGHLLRVITHKHPFLLPRSEKIENIEVKRILFFNPVISSVSSKSIISYLGTFLLSPFYFISFTHYMWVFRADIINYHFIGSPTLFLLIYLIFFRQKLVVSLHGADVESGLSTSKVSKFLFKCILRKADAITVNSYYLYEKVVNKEGFSKDKISIASNGINFEYLEQSPVYSFSDKYIFAAGRLVHKKGFDILIEAFSLFTSASDKIKLIIAGSGPLKEEMESLIKKLGLCGKIILLGEAGRSKISSLLKGCEFFILPSRDEPFGLVILEAMATGKTVIATCSGGPQEIITNGIDGILVPKNDSKALADAMRRLADDSLLRDKIIANINQSALRMKFGINASAEYYLKVFEQAGGNKEFKK